MSTEEQKTKKREGPSSDELCDSSKKRATDASEYYKYASRDATKVFECPNCKAEFGSWYGRCDTCKRPEGCMCEEAEESQEMCEFCCYLDPDCSKIPRNLIEYAKENFCLSQWTGRCKGCGNRCCCKCLKDERFLCQKCAKTKAECSLCLNIMKNHLLRSHPKCRGSYSNRLEEWIQCKYCKKCAKDLGDSCSSCDRKATSDEKDTKTSDEDPYYCSCFAFMGYEGERCGACGKYVCFDCMPEKNEFCIPCMQKYYRVKDGLGL